MEAYRQDHAREEIHNQGWNWGQLWNNVTKTGSNSLYTGAYGLGIGALGLLAVKTAQTTFVSNIFSKINSLTDSYIPSFKGTLNAGLVIGASNMVAIPVSKYLKNRDHETLATIAGALTVFLATTALTPKVSRQLSTYPVSYLSASLYGLAGAGTFLATDNNSYVYRNRHSSLWDKFIQTGSDSLSAGAFSLAAATLGLLAIKTTQALTPSIWGILPAGTIVGLSTAATIPLSHKVAKLITDDKENQNASRVIFSAAVALLATALCTPKLSSKFPHSVSYLGAAGYSLIGALAAGGATILDLNEEKKRGEPQFRPDRFEHAGRFQEHAALVEEEEADFDGGYLQHQHEHGHALMRHQLPEQKGYPQQHLRRPYQPALRREREQPQPHPVRSYDKKDYLRIGVLSVGSGVLTGVVAGIFLGLGALWSRASEAYPILKGSVTIGAVGGAATGVALLTADWDKYQEWKDSTECDPEPFPTWDFVVRVAAVFTTIVALTPTASKYLSSYRVSYLQAAGLSVPAVAGAAGVFFGGITILENLPD